MNTPEVDGKIKELILSIEKKYSKEPKVKLPQSITKNIPSVPLEGNENVRLLNKVLRDLAMNRIKDLDMFNEIID
jgi:hypothetical protein